MAPTSPSASAAAPKLPASADFNALYNRISLASAKQATFLTSMRAKYPSLARSSSKSTSEITPSSAAPGTFSSMSKPVSSTETTTTTTSTTSRPRAAADDADLRFENPNTGLGFATPKVDQATSAATRDLSRRLLGNKRGGRGADDPKALAAAALKKRRLQDDESDEEEGRGSWGKSKKKTKVRQESPEREVLEHPAARGDVEMREGGLNDIKDQIQNNLQDSKEHAPVPSPAHDQEAIAAIDPAEGKADKRPETDEAAKERKRNKKKRNKENKKNTLAAAAAASEGDAGAAQEIPVA
ncbi:hypothetical protein BDP55DRAFT_729749 [Colletotrichum godetiae]|uniref:Uncharacterized protein n=1 Tax=Colletotrichum godetiae TaxID=1209918 RepID=A0AAJ0AL13_9PEZI|nr:uncharacterized protein BDP55DRAFT_729749 [Colletotrichum godetiae]KAK1674368.1 hypothetical protein BDP55DRAFT_729749 [Colletotrichum godetiae]